MQSQHLVAPHADSAAAVIHGTLRLSHGEAVEQAAARYGEFLGLEYECLVR